MPDPTPSTAPARVTFPRTAWIVLAAFATLQLGLLVAQFALQRDQQTTVDAQLRTAVRQANQALPLLEDARPLVQDLRDSEPGLRRVGRKGEALADTLLPLARELRNARADEVAREVGALSRTLLNADVGATTRAVRDLAVRLQPVGDVTDELLRQDRLRRLLVRSTSVLGEVRQRDLVAKGAAAAEAVPAEIVPLLKRTIQLQQELLEIARSTERHAASLDRKTGGEVPSAGTTLP